MQVVIKIAKWRLLLISILSAVFIAVGMVLIYEKTKNAYRSVGFNDGSIAANMEIIQRLNEIGVNVTVCTVEQQIKAKKIISVKSEVLYLLTDDFGKSIFCKSK